jgi:hypothetical protein
MFISKAEKEDLFHRIRVLEQTVKFLEKKLVQLLAPIPEPEKKRTMSLENRAKLSAMMKKRHADAKAKKEPRT